MSDGPYSHNTVVSVNDGRLKHVVEWRKSPRGRNPFAIPDNKISAISVLGLQESGGSACMVG